MIKWTIFAFCNISCVSFIIETVQNADDLFEKKKIPFLTQSLSNFLVIFFEDIPLLVLNLIVTLCRDGEPTTISMVKSSAGIAIVVLRFFLMILVYWLLDSKKSRCGFFMDIMSTFGLFVIALISISIQYKKNSFLFIFVQLLNKVFYFFFQKIIKHISNECQWLDPNNTRTTF